MNKVLFLLSMIFLLTACGKQGPLIPPEALVPAPIADLRADQRGNNFLVCWSAPRKKESGEPLGDLAGFRVFRRDVLPPDQDCETCQESYRQVKTVDPEYLQDVRRVGSRFCFYDTDLVDGKTYQYKVLTVEQDGTTSRDSNKARHKKLAPPTAPKLTAIETPNGVTLKWKAPPTTASSSVTGYAVYRKQKGEAMPLVPIAVLPAGTYQFEDPQMEHGVSYEYVLRTVATADGETLESDPSNTVTGKFSLSEE